MPMNIRQLLVSAAALSGAALLSSCTVDGYGYSATYGTDYYDSSYYSPSYYGTTVYTGRPYYSRPYCNTYSSHSHYVRPRPGHSTYCPPSRPSSGHGSWSGGGHGSHSGHAPVIVSPPRGGGGGGGFSGHRESSRPSPVIESRPVVESRPPERERPSGGGGSSEWGGARTFGDMVRDAKRH